MKTSTTLRKLWTAATLCSLIGGQPVRAAEVSGCLSEFPAPSCGIVQATVELQPLGLTSENTEFFSFENVAAGSYMLRVTPPCNLFGCWVPTPIEVADEDLFVRIPMRTACVGDCNNDCSIRIDETVRGVGILLGEQALAACAAFDKDFSGSLAVDEIVSAVNFALAGCPSRPPSCP